VIGSSGTETHRDHDPLLATYNLDDQKVDYQDPGHETLQMREQQALILSQKADESRW